MFDEKKVWGNVHERNALYKQFDLVTGIVRKQSYVWQFAVKTGVSPLEPTNKDSTQTPFHFHRKHICKPLGSLEWNDFHYYFCPVQVFKVEKVIEKKIV